MASAHRIVVQGVVQGVGFRPFVYRLARRHGLRGWVLNGEAGVEIRLEGDEAALERFLLALTTESPPAAVVAGTRVERVPPEGLADFVIRQSRHEGTPTVRIAPDLAVCDACLGEMRDTGDRRYGYPYINCTDCGPRYSIVTALPYDRPNTTMAAWPLCGRCRREYLDPLDRRFHAQPVACPDCGPSCRLIEGGSEAHVGSEAIAAAAALLAAGGVVAVKGLGGYHLACDAADPAAVRALRERKFRKEKAFALMAATVAAVREVAQLDAEAERLLTSVARPIVLAPKRRPLAGVAPDNGDYGVMLPYTPLHHLLFAAGAPELLVMTSANRSSEPIAYHDDEALASLPELADALLLGERPIARRLDDSVVRTTPFGVTVLRRARGYAPSAVARVPSGAPILALGADLKSSVTLVVDGQAFVGQHLGDLEHYGALVAFRECIADLTRMYRVDVEDAIVVHDAHPGYRSSQHALTLPARAHLAVQHHRAHVASVLAERGAWDARVLGVAWDGTGYGDDGAIWGGEFFVGGIREGFERVGQLRYAPLPGGDAAARHPVQAAAGFLAGLELPDLSAAPFAFPARYRQARALIEAGTRVFTTSSAGRLFDTVAALLGFTRATTFEGQAAMWLEHLAAASSATDAYPLPFEAGELDHRPALQALVADRLGGRDPGDIARAFHAGLARGIAAAVSALRAEHPFEAVVLAGGVFQNNLLLACLKRELAGSPLAVWLPAAVPMNDGGIGLGQAAIAAAQQGLRSGVWNRADRGESAELP